MKNKTFCWLIDSLCRLKLKVYSKIFAGFNWTLNLQQVQGKKRMSNAETIQRENMRKSQKRRKTTPPQEKLRTKAPPRSLWRGGRMHWASLTNPTIQVMRMLTARICSHLQRTIPECCLSRKTIEVTSFVSENEHLNTFLLSLNVMVVGRLGVDVCLI